MSVRIWSVFDREGRLVLACSDQPGEFNFARPPDDSADPVCCDFATLQAYDARAEPVMLNEVFRARDLPDFLARLARLGYRVREGRPRPGRFARL